MQYNSTLKFNIFCLKYAVTHHNPLKKTQQIGPITIHLGKKKKSN